MNNDFNFETFLYLSPNKLILLVSQKNDFELIYKNEISIDKTIDELNFKKIDEFLNENIFKAEKILNSFIQNIYIAIMSEDLSTFQISVKKNNHNRIIDESSLIYLLNDARDECKNSIINKKIIHIIINNYLIDNNLYQDLPKNIQCKNFSLELSFICLDNNLIKNIEKIMKNYQISVNQLLSANYIKEYSEKQNLNFFESMSKIVDGSNSNEVKIVQKTSKNRGFFEKFFDFFD